MNKAKLVSLILLVAIALTGAGYAYWNDTIVVAGTVTTGELCVELLEYDDLDDVDSPYVNYINSDGEIERRDYDESRIEPFVISRDKHTLTAKFVNVFPGMYYCIPFRMINKGTIPAVLKDCTVTWDIKDSTLSGYSESVLRAELEENLKISNLQMKVYNKANTVLNTITFVNGPSITLGQLENKLNEVVGNNQIRLEPGDYIQLASSDGEVAGGSVRFLFGGGFENNFENREFTVNINMDWKQFNDLR